MQMFKSERDVAWSPVNKKKRGRENSRNSERAGKQKNKGKKIK